MSQSLSDSLHNDWLKFKKDGFGYDRRSWIISVYLVMLVFLLSLKSYFDILSPVVIIHTYQNFTNLLAVSYGFDFISLVFYFIYCQVGLIKYGKRSMLFFDVFLLLNLLLTVVSFLLLFLFILTGMFSYDWLLGYVFALNTLYLVSFAFYPVSLLVDIVVKHPFWYWLIHFTTMFIMLSGFGYFFTSYIFVNFK